MTVSEGVLENARCRAYEARLPLAVAGARSIFAGQCLVEVARHNGGVVVLCPIA